ncbi:hypothetical protein LPMP_030230 [Leishmania panamensis]|uniref:Uncharacterized protein n=3 Tax=Leishmania guyanensis species complex TaxID=38579 RepID=A0A088RH10_LEIPA|nr:hypothetical protein LPMP_030230 [Leishmania panamensis]AIN95257.1 hypothetical protein LPMP_030230 [Leishmania panamensis]CCM12622.1 hypothetical protein, conserved [Leishmania guyanensis]
MLRRTARCAMGNSRFSGSKERDRIEQERRRHVLYDAAGNLQIGGLLLLMYDDFKKPAAVGLAIAVFLYGYNRLLVHLSREEEAEGLRLDVQSEAVARQTGKLKADRYLVKPNRQIDDPDFFNIPALGGKGVNSSRLLSDDSVSSGTLHSERNRSS